MLGKMHGIRRVTFCSYAAEAIRLAKLHEITACLRRGLYQLPKAVACCAVPEFNFSEDGLRPNAPDVLNRRLS